jgi:hypothetical protein
MIMDVKNSELAFFDFRPTQVISQAHVGASLEASNEASKVMNKAAFELNTRGGDRQEDLSNQFLVFQLTDQGVEEPTTVQPKSEGSSDNPDMLVGISLEAFQVPAADGAAPAATLRFTMGKSPASSDRIFDTAFWCVATGLQLWDQAHGKAPAKDLNSDFQKAFGKRPIEIPGGLAVMSLEVVRHKPQEWWQKIFTFLESSAGKALVSTIGFPAVASSAISAIDELLNRVIGGDAQVLFKSRPLTLALSKYAADTYTGGNSSIAVGVLNQGWVLLARGGDYKRITDRAKQIKFYPTLGIIAPSDVKIVDLISDPKANVFSDLTYGILRVGMKPTKLDPTFNYG